MNKQDIINKLNQFNLDKNEYWLMADSAMIFYGLRQQTNDIDIGCTTKLADKLAQTYPCQLRPDGTRRIELAKDIEVYENWLYDKVVQIEDIPVVSLQGILETKLVLNRPKDQEDIMAIKKALSNQD